MMQMFRGTSSTHSVADNHVVVFQPAVYGYYSDIANNLVAFTDSNQMLSYHWYRDEFRTSNNGPTSGTWVACTKDYSTLDGMWDNRNAGGCPPPDAGCPQDTSCHTDALRLLQIQQNFPNEAVSIGEFGNIYETAPTYPNQPTPDPNTANNTAWNLQSIQVFMNHNAVGYFYWGYKQCASTSTCTWNFDLGKTPVWPFASCLTATAVGSISVTLSWKSAVASLSSTSGVTYNVYRDASTIPIFTGTNNVTTDPSAGGVSSHKYKVEAVDSNNQATMTGPATTVTMPSTTAIDFNLVTNSACPPVLGFRGSSYAGDASSMITISAFNGFSGQVSLSSSVSPPGPAVNLWASVVFPNPTGPVLVSLDTFVSTGVAAGNYNVTIQGCYSSCSLSHTVSLSLYLSPDFGFMTQDGSPQSITVVPGNWQSTGIWVNSLAKFAGTINVAVTADPQITSQSGITYYVTSPSMTLSSGGSLQNTLVVTASSSTPEATYCCIYVKGISGALSHLIKVSVTVKAGLIGGSVLSGTLITLANRTRVPVQTLSTGMQLRSYDMISNQFVNSTITGFNSVAVNNYMVIMTTAGWPLIVDQNPVQRVYVVFANATWTLMPVTQLQVGYYLFQPETGTLAMITNLYYHTGGSYTMYDIYNTAPSNYIANTYLDPVKQ
jgi:hypothetical protein